MMQDKFQLYLRVRYCECDAQGVVFNARYGDYVDIAMTEFMRQLFGGYTEMLEQGMDNQVVNLTIDWQSSAKFDDVLAIGVQCERVGNSSFTLSLKFLEQASGRAVANAQITYVLVSSANYEKINVPDSMREKLLSGVPGVVVNYAGT